MCRLRESLRRLRAIASMSAADWVRTMGAFALGVLARHCAGA